MTEDKVSEKKSIGMEIDLDLTLNVADKVTDFLDNSMKKPLERYMVARLISILYEETLNFSLDPEFEAEVRKLAKEKTEKLDGDSC